MLLSGHTLADIIALTIALLLAFSVHEFSHAWMATYLGDPTARYQGRLTLDPRAHLDVLGTLMIYMVGFGWAKPVPVNPYNLRNGAKTGMAMVAVMGPISNLAMAALFAVPIRLGIVSGPFFRSGVFPTVGDVIVTIVGLNIALAVFNLIPLAPLDGFRVAVGLLPWNLAYKVAQYEQYGPAILLFILLAENFAHIRLLSAVMGPAIQLVGRIILGR